MPGLGPALVPPDFSPTPAVSFHAPSSISHSSPGLRRTRVVAVPWPMEGRIDTAFTLRSRMPRRFSEFSMTVLRYDHVNNNRRAWFGDRKVRAAIRHGPCVKSPPQTLHAV